MLVACQFDVSWLVYAHKTIFSIFFRGVANDTTFRSIYANAPISLVENIQI
jgi:hypothetical protein